MRRVDEDRWLASRFAAGFTRKRLTALYALNYEIARTAESVTQGALGDIRLAWWRDAIAEIRAGAAPRAHPVAQAFAEAQRETPFSAGVLDALIAARGKDLDAAPFQSWADLEAYVDATAGGVLRLAIEACAAGPAPEAFIAAAGRAWGLVGLVRAAPFWRAQGRTLTPPGESLHALLDRARHAHAALRTLAREAPTALFPAYGYLALAPGYLRRLNDLERAGATMPLVVRQLTLVRASATGRL